MERQRRLSSKRLSAFTLVELLVVIAIIGVLVALLLPAVQAAREAARRTQCANQVKQIMLSMINHESAKGAFPSGGIVPWPRLEDYQSGPGGAPYGPEKQGLGWMFQILPYLEGGNVYNLKTSQEVEAVNPDGFNCPSRRGPTQATLASETSSTVYPYLCDYAAAVPYKSSSQFGIPPGIASPFYKINGTDTVACAGNTFWGISSNSALAHPGDMKTITDLGPSFAGFWGVIVRSNLCVGCGGSSPTTGFYTKISYSQIPDGSSNTLVIGEKRLVPSQYETGTWHDDKGFSSGWDPDALRASYCEVGPDEESADARYGYRFGAAHPSTLNTGFADGSVQSIAYDIDLELFNSLAHREDGGIVNTSDL